MKKFLLFILILSSGLIQAADNATISGTIKDDKNSPLPYATVVLINSVDSSIVKGELTDDGGKYKFENISNGNYHVMVAQLGFEKIYSEGFEITSASVNIPVSDLSLKASAVQLQEATVTAMRPFIEHRIDRTIVNVENSIVNAGATALEILQRSPGVTVDNDGNIILAGKQGVLVMMDGKPTYLSQKDLYELLRNTGSDQLSSIEIITNPSAKYDASGTSGIINIKMRKKQNTGFNGRVQISYGQGAYPDFGSGFNLNYGSEKVNIFSGYDYMNGFYYERINLLRKFTENGSTSAFKQHTFDKGHFQNHNFRGGADFFLSKKHTAGILVKSYQNFNNERTTSTTDIFNNSEISDSGYVTFNQNESKWTNISGNLNYRYQIDTLGREFTADADYAHFSNASDFIISTDYYLTGSYYTYGELATSQQPAKIDIRSFKVDYTHPFSSIMKIETGAKASYVTTDNDVQFFNYAADVPVLDITKTNHFKYSENINAVYLTWSSEIGKFGLQTGLRAEQTISKGDQFVDNSSFERDYLQLFPSVFMSYKFSDKHQLNSSYSRRIDRPAYQQLNPFKYFIDPYNYMEGNPLLEAQLTNSFELKYTYMQMFSFAINYSHTTDAMTQITKQIDSTRTTFVTTENLDSYDNYGINLSVPVKITEWLHSSNNFNLFNNRYQGISSVGLVEKNLTSYTFNSTNSLSLPKGFSAEINFWYNSEMVWGTWLVQPQYALSGGISKMFLKDRMQIRMNLNDVLHTEITHSKIKYQNIDADFRRVYDSQFVRFHISYKFGKQTQRAQRRMSSSQEEQDRVRQGH
jgi:outer membrane receptor protein involved in Fe transport